jgi:hypothetical protein
MLSRACLIALLLVGGCKRSPAVDGCQILFGNPNDQTGLTSDQCRPQCACNGNTFKPPVYSAAFIQALIDDWVPSQPYPPFTVDPYTMPAPADDPAGTVCAVLPGADAHPRPYTLVTYSSAAAANAAGARVTHFGRCGACSTLANLAVYMRNNDLTAPVRQCAFASAEPDGGDPDLACLMAMGFDLQCAQIWAFNTNHTRNVCLRPCLASFGDPYNLPDGGLNACLQCDEDQSGPWFKAYAGRTRRNSGLANAICRPCSEVQPLVHSY